MIKVSGTIVTLNEERNIARAIESMRCCDEIVVVDSGSTDRTRAISSGLGARVIEQPWLGYAQQKNCAAGHAAFDWILSLDADEALSDSLEAEIWKLKNDGPRHHAYAMPRMAQYMGRWIKYSGWYPDRKVRLYDRRSARWAGAYVHESVAVEGATGQLHSDILHFTCDSLSEHLRTLDRYTTLAAREIVALGRRASLRHLVFSPPWTFVRAYILQRGFRDGFPGFTIAWMAALYTFLKYAKARELA
jgi:glycosyltransferase involved in cell wall biosynthesis